MPASMNTFTTEDFADMQAKLPDVKKVVEGEITEWNVEDVSIMYTLSISLIYELSAGIVEENETRIKNVLNFMLNNFDGSLGDDAIKVSIITLDRHGIHVDDVEGIEDEKRFKKVLDKTRNRH